MGLSSTNHTTKEIIMLKNQDFRVGDEVYILFPDIHGEDTHTVCEPDDKGKCLYVNSAPDSKGKP